MVVWGVVNETKGNILHKAQAPPAPLSTFISLRLLLGGDGAGVVSPGPVLYTHTCIHAGIIHGYENGTRG